MKSIDKNKSIKKIVKLNNDCDKNCGCGRHEHNHNSIAVNCNCDKRDDIADNCDCGGHERDDITDNCGCGEHGHERDDIADNCGCGGHERDDITDNCGCGGHERDDITDNCGCALCDTHVDLSAQGIRINKNQVIFKTCSIITSVILLILGSFIKLPRYYELAFFIPAFLIVGGEYLFKTAQNILKGRIFDENFLMTIAGIGAFAIGEYQEGVAVMLLFSIGLGLQELAVSRSKRSITDMLNLKTPFASRVDGDAIVKVATDELNIGDTVMVASGEKIPMDGIIVSGDTFADYSMLNGEYKPKHLKCGEEILGGSILKGGAINIRITKLFKDTTAAKIIELVQNSQDKKPKTEQFITKFAKYYTPCVVLIALIIAIIPPIARGFSEYFVAYLRQAMVFLVISCPCALVISVPLGFFAGIGGASKHGILFKGGNYLEALNTVDTLIFDKTGTLTEGTFEVREIVASDNDTDALLEICAYAESKSNHPIAQSILKHYNQSIDLSRITDYEELEGFGIKLKLDGNDMLCGRASLLENNGIAVMKTATVGTIIHLSRANNYLGYIIINDKIKSESYALIKNLKAMNKRILLMSGDTESSVKSVADELGIAEYRHSLLPQDKAELVTSLIAQGRKVAFVGDGLNDAPVLKLATVGICVSGLNNDASIEAADVVLSSANIDTVSTALRAARRIRRVVGVNIAMSIVTKIVIMIVSVTVLPSMWLALIADVGVSLVAILNSVRLLKI